MRAMQRTIISLKDLSKELKKSGRHSLLSFFKPSAYFWIKCLDTEANTFCDKIVHGIILRSYLDVILNIHFTL